jgi:DNA-binding SARP family transcriptional activator
MNDDMTFRVLGPLQVRRGVTSEAIGGHRERAILAALLLTPGEPVTVERLVELSWPTKRPRDEGHALRTHVMRLRRHLGRDAIITAPGAYSIPVALIAVDAHRFSAAVERATESLWDARLNEAEASFVSALEIWPHGDAWVDLAGCPFGNAERARLAEARLEVEERLAALRFCHHRSRVDVIEKLALETPLREHRWLLLMHALFSTGQQTRALRSYATLRSRLQQEAGLEPEPRLRAMEHRILTQDQTLLGLDPLGLVLG